MPGVMKRNFLQLNRETFVDLYKAIVIPHIECANSVSGPFKLIDIKAVEKVQMRATKLVIGLKNLPYCKCLRKLKLPTLKYRRLRGDVIEVYKILTRQNDANVSLKLILNQTKATRGHDYKLLHKSFHYDFRKYSFSCRVVNVWNSLPQHVVEASNTNIFKTRLDKFWSNQDCKYLGKADLSGTGSRSGVLCNYDDEAT